MQRKAARYGMGYQFTAFAFAPETRSARGESSGRPTPTLRGRGQPPGSVPSGLGQKPKVPNLEQRLDHDSSHALGSVEQPRGLAREDEGGDREESGRVCSPGLDAAGVQRASRWVYHADGYFTLSAVYARFRKPL